MRCLAVLLFLGLIAGQVFAADEPFTNPSNWGGTGLMEVPSARVLRENAYRIGYSQIKPYRYYYGVVSPLKGLEIGGRITEVIGVPGFSGSAGAQYGNYKDKSLDFKYQLISEGKYMPAFAIGIMDPHGTRLYSSQYIAFSKQIYPFDFTLGFGNGRFGKKPLPPQGEGIRLEMFQDTKQWLLDSQFFWGVEFAPSKKYAFMVEYSPIQYHKQTNDPASRNYFNESVPSNYNFGFRWKPLKWTEIDLSYQRGNQIGVNFSMNFDIGKPLIPIYDLPYREKPEHKLNPLSERIITALYSSGFSDIGVSTKNDELWIEAQNDKYYFSAKALGVILKIVAEIADENIQKVRIILKDNGIPLLELITAREDIIDLYADKLTVNEFLYLSTLNNDISDTKGYA